MKLLIFTILVFISFLSVGQPNNIYIPVTINAPQFIIDKDKELQIGTKINNYGLHFNLAGKLKRKIIIFSIQQNNGNIQFDPLNFNKEYYAEEETHLIQSHPTKMFYCELGLGYNFNFNAQKLSLIAGVGQEFTNTNTRYFIQIDWGNESKLMNAGLTIRANYTTVNDNSLVTLEPMVQGKLKLWKLRLVSQFGYSISLKENQDYMKPILTFGLEYTL